jgi:hypothetical protein
MLYEMHHLGMIVTMSSLKFLEVQGKKFAGLRRKIRYFAK